VKQLTLCDGRFSLLERRLKCVRFRKTNVDAKCFVSVTVLALLKRTASSRIVIVASDLYKLAKLNLAKPNPTNQLPAYLYYVSKCANIMFSMELARRLKQSNAGDCFFESLRFFFFFLICRQHFAFSRRFPDGFFSNLYDRRRAYTNCIPKRTQRSS